MTRSPMKPAADERGMAMVIALLVLLVLSLLATVLMVSVNVDTKITGHGLRETSALNAAEAGIGEATSRIIEGDLDLASNPRAVAQIFNCTSGSEPTLGSDSTALATAQPSGAWLPYSTASRGPNALTVEYKTNVGRTRIYTYDDSRSPAVDTTSGGMPIYVITSTGVVGGDRRAVRAEIYAKTVPAYVQGALTASVNVHTKGTFEACGLNHRADTPVDNDGSAYHTGSGDMPGIWSTGTISHQGASSSDGNPADVPSTSGPYSGTNGFYAGPWEVFGLSQSQFFSWVGSPVSYPPDPADGVYYVDQACAYHGGSGSGFLYVDGDLTVNAGFTYRGIIYVKGDLKINGHAWILGAVIVEGTTDIDLANGTANILYSSDAITQALANSSGAFQRLSWRELP
jgi:Tfp pilus assembly protein PilX